ncbi:MAG: class I SAM-dependent methyltransferase [Mycobacteriales bacterium]
MPASALEDWAGWLEDWAVPPEILANAEASPWVLPREVFSRRADRQIAEPTGPTHGAALAALEQPGTVLDVGSGAGATSLALIGRAPVTAITAVDNDADLLAAFAERAEQLPVGASAVKGWWPDVAVDVKPADVVVCGHVLYNIRDLGPFVLALTDHARRQVVVEITARHPLASLNPLWQRFHAVTRPGRPTADDCLAALAEVGISPEVTRWSRPAEPEYAEFGDLVEVTRRRLCLPAGAAAEVAVALREMGQDPANPPDLGSSGRELVTMTWAGTAAGRGSPRAATRR